MASSLIVPFNFQPVSLWVVNSGTYTIPAGRYAKVTVSLFGNSTFTLNGNVAARCSSHVVLESDSLTMRAAGSGGSALAVNNDPNSNTGPAGAAFNETTSNQVLTADYWIPSGVVLGGTGTWSAVVQEYYNIN